MAIRGAACSPSCLAFARRMAAPTVHGMTCVASKPSRRYCTLFELRRAGSLGARAVQTRAAGVARSLSNPPLPAEDSPTLVLHSLRTALEAEARQRCSDAPSGPGGAPFSTRAARALRSVAGRLETARPELGRLAADLERLYPSGNALVRSALLARCGSLLQGLEKYGEGGGADEEGAVERGVSEDVEIAADAGPISPPFAPAARQRASSLPLSAPIQPFPSRPPRLILPPRRPRGKALAIASAPAPVPLAAEPWAPPPALAPDAQRSPAWHAARRRRLTASAFARALGFFPGERTALWLEKAGLAGAFAGNAATAWGTRQEPRALEHYRRHTRRSVAHAAFAVAGSGPERSWIGASPDGLVEGSDALRQNEFLGASHRAPSCEGGLLEIKCPYFKGEPASGSPPLVPPYYYMPQIQGQLDILNRPWCDLYVWTPCAGAAAFRVERDAGYWRCCYEVLAQFWWAHVVPALHVLEEEARGGSGLEAAREQVADSRVYSVTHGEVALAFAPLLRGGGEELELRALVCAHLDEGSLPWTPQVRRLPPALREALAALAPPDAHPEAAALKQASLDMAQNAVRTLYPP